MFKVADGVFLIDTLFMNMNGFVASYLIKGSKAAIIDVGYPATYMNVVKGVKEALGDVKSVEYIIPTHVHLDHGGASGHLLREFPNSIVVTHKKGAKHIVDPTKLINSVKSIFPEDKLKYMGLPIPADADKVKGVEGVDDIIDIGNGIELRLIYTPGHAYHHISIFDERSGILFTGDAIAVKYPNFPIYIPTTPAPSFDPQLAIKSIEKLEELEPRLLMVPHFGPVENPEEYFEISKKKIVEWVNKVKEIVDSGDFSLDSVMDEMIKYVANQAGVPPENVPINVIGSIYISVFGLLHYLIDLPSR